jgi:hypothetical protein
VLNPLRIRVAPTAAAARRLLRGGYCPIECSFGATSVVCRLSMDHHGSLHELPGVAVRAYEESFGERAARPWFAVTGHADEDATWAIGSLAGLLPHPRRDAEYRRAPDEMRAAWTRDWSALARLINRVDTDPAPLDLTATREGRIMLSWRLLGSFPLRDSLAFHAGIDRWRSLLTQADDDDLEKASELLVTRITRLRSLRHERFGKDVALIDASIWGFCAVYAWEWYEQFQVPVLFVFQPGASGRGTVTVGVRDASTAEALYGPGGLLNLFGRLRPRGWGGRPVIGGSGRARPLSWEDARGAARTAARQARG